MGLTDSSLGNTELDNTDLTPDISKLQQLLSEGQWKAADYETYLVMLDVVGRKPGDWLRPEEVKTFPAGPLVAIDELWRKYSQQKFGFSIQKKIYLDLYRASQAPGAQASSPEAEELTEFTQCVGWQVDGYSDLVFDLDASPKGHLPGCWAFRFFGFGWYLMSHPGLE